MTCAALVLLSLSVVAPQAFAQAADQPDPDPPASEQDAPSESESDSSATPAASEPSDLASAQSEEEARMRALIGIEISPEDADGAQVADIRFRSARTIDGEREILREPPVSIDSEKLKELLRSQEGLPLSAADLASDIATLSLTQGADGEAVPLDQRHGFFPEVEVKILVSDVGVNSGVPRLRVNLSFICEEARVASISFRELRQGQIVPWDGLARLKGISLEPGDVWDPEQLDGDLRALAQNVLASFDVQNAWRKDGVHIEVLVAEEREIQRTIVVGIREGDEQEILKRGDFDATYARYATAEQNARTIRNYYREKGYAHAEVSWQVLEMPRYVTPENIHLRFPQYPVEIVEDIWDKVSAAELDKIGRADGERYGNRVGVSGGDAVLAFWVHEGPQVRIADISFEGVEQLVDLPDSRALEPGQLGNGSFWPLWYALPSKTREERITRSLYRAMQDGPSILSNQPTFSLATAYANADRLQRYLREGGWREAVVALTRIRYNEDRSRVKLGYKIVPNAGYVVTYVAVRVQTLPTPQRLRELEVYAKEKGLTPRERAELFAQNAVEPAATMEEIWEAMEFEGELVHDRGATLPGMQGQLPPGYDALDESYRIYRLKTFQVYGEEVLEGVEGDLSQSGALGRVREIFEEQGYARVGVDRDDSMNLRQQLPPLPGTDRQPASLRGFLLALDINQGQKYRIGTINVRGNEETREATVRRHFKLLPGEILDVKELRRGKNRLLATGWFETREQTKPGVEVTPIFLDDLSEIDPDYLVANIDVAVREGPTGNFNFSGGFSPSQGPQIQFQLSKRNLDVSDLRSFTGAGQELSFFAELPIGDTQRYAISFTEPYIMGYPFSGRIETAFQEDDLGPFTNRRIGFEIAIGHGLTRDLDVIFSYENYNTQVRDVSPSATYQIQREAGRISRYAAFGVEFRYETFNRRIFPSEGNRFSIKGELANKYFGGNIDMWRLTGRAAQAFLLDQTDLGQITLQMRAIGIWQRPYARSETTPLPQRQYLGSISALTALRGYRRSGVGPSADGDPLGGDFLLNATAEVALELQPNFFWLVGFVDVGELVPDIRNFDPDGFTVTAGFGLRLMTPLAPVPIGFDFGWPIYSQPGNRRQVLALNISFAF